MIKSIAVLNKLALNVASMDPLSLTGGVASKAGSGFEFDYSEESMAVFYGSVDLSARQPKRSR